MPATLSLLSCRLSRRPQSWRDQSRADNRRPVCPAPAACPRRRPPCNRAPGSGLFFVRPSLPPRPCAPLRPNNHGRRISLRPMRRTGRRVASAWSRCRLALPLRMANRPTTRLRSFRQRMSKNEVPRHFREPDSRRQPGERAGQMRFGCVFHSACSG